MKEAIRELFATETAAARSVLSERRDRDTPVKLSVRAAQRAERTFLPVTQSVACKAGCSFCCHGVSVDVTAPEALTIARGFRETLSREHLAVIVQRVKQSARAIRTMTLAERRQARTPCSMLDEKSNRCAVYDARPMRCRAHHSLDVAACEAHYLHPEEKRGIPRYPDVMNAYEAMILGQRRALARAKLDLRHFELSLALEVALENDDAAERWANGERLFDAAVFEWPDAEPPQESEVPRMLLDENPWKRERRTLVYENDWIAVNHDDVEQPDGKPGIYGVVHFKHRAIGVVAIDAADRVLLVGQYRYPLDAYSWEIPEGGGRLDEDPVAAARRELLEETGVTAKRWTRLGRAHLSNSVSDEEAIYFLAEELERGEADPEGTEQLEVRWVAFPEALRMVHAGEITDSISVIALLKLSTDRAASP